MYCQGQCECTIYPTTTTRMLEKMSALITPMIS